jgi:ferredoxin-thioredoxin reductase catalytic subunit/rhodanese-related sulfurtransferase
MSEIKKVDPESAEFKEVLVKTLRFTDKVIKQFNWVYNPDNDITGHIQMGLTRNKMIYNKRYCPCFFVQNDKTDRVCPCPPAIEKEIPEDGVCHCQIFCTPEYAANKKAEMSGDEAVYTHSRGLTQAEAEAILAKEQIDSEELEALIEAKNLGMVNFNLLDVREWMEYQSGYINGVDHLVPTTSFHPSLQEANLDPKVSVIVYCHVGSRSAYCQRLLGDMGFKHVSNLTHGIVSYRGEIKR